MNLTYEKDCALSAQQVYQIIADAIDAADDEGFVNSYIFERCLYIYAVRELYPDLVDTINTSLLEDGSPLITWNRLLEDGTIDAMVEEYNNTLVYLANAGQVWFEEYTEAAHSMRSLVDVINTLMEGMSGNLGKQLDMFKQDSDIQGVINLADKWGMDRDGESLFGTAE